MRGWQDACGDEGVRLPNKRSRKTAEVPRVQSVGKAVSAPVAGQRPVLAIQVVNGEELHEDADDSRSNGFGRDESDAVEFFKQTQETSNPKSEHLSPNIEEQNDHARIPEKPEVKTGKTRVDTAERIHQVRQAAAKQAWFRIEGETRLIDIW